MMQGVKKNMSVRPLVAVIVLVLLLLAVPDRAPAQQAMGPEVTSPADVKLREALQSLDTDSTTRYVEAFYDLNDDGHLEAIVYLIGDYWCGSGGCTMLVLSENGQSWKVVSTVKVTRLPIWVLDEKLNGWHSLAVQVSGGGIVKSYLSKLQFDGQSYPNNPTVPPAIQVTQPSGKVLIGSAASAKPLH
jgi:hypothetical protein